MSKNPYAPPTGKKLEAREKGLEKIWTMATNARRISPELQEIHRAQQAGETIVSPDPEEDEE